MDAQKLHPAIDQGHHVEGARRAQPAHDAARDLDFRRDDHVDGHLLGAEQSAGHRLEVAMVAQPRDAPLHAEQGVGDLAGHHVDLVGAGDGDQHVGVAGPGALEHLRMGGVADDPAHVVALVDAPRLLGRVVDHRDVDLARQMAGDGRADLPGAADDDPHQARRRRRLGEGVERHREHDDHADDHLLDVAARRCSSTRPLSSTPISSVPTTVPKMVPMPPNRLVPPMTTEAMTVSS